MLYVQPGINIFVLFFIFLIKFSFSFFSISGIQSASVQLLSNRLHEVVILKCHVEASSGDGLLEIEWFRNSEKLSSLKNIELQENRLLIHKPTALDSGLYRCIASNAAGKVISRKGYILKWSQPKSQQYDSSRNCIPRLKKNYIISESMKHTFLCRGKRGGDDNLKLPPADVVITKGPAKLLQVRENEPAELNCAFSNKQPQPTDVILRWHKDGKIFRQIDVAANDNGNNAERLVESNKDPMLREDARVSIAKDNGSLIFTSVIASDAGKYVCQIVIEGYRPTTSEPGELQVIEQLKFMPQPTSKNLELGSVGKVHCKAQGTPAPQVKWLKVSSHINNNNGNDINRKKRSHVVVQRKERKKMEKQVVPFFLLFPF